MGDTSAASASELEVVRKAVLEQAFPRGIAKNGLELQFGEDSAGKEAIWIRLPVERGYENPSEEWVAEVRQFVNKLRKELLAKDLRHWPYIDLKTVD